MSWTLFQELELYKEELLQKPAVLALNKIDIEGADRKVQEVLRLVENMEGAALLPLPVRTGNHRSHVQQRCCRLMES